MRKSALATFIASSCVMAVAGCAPTQAPSEVPHGTVVGGHGMTVGQKAQCVAGGGRVERRGRGGFEMCVTPFSDATKTCTDTSQCQGKCVGAVPEKDQPLPMSGQCQADDRLFGCYSEIVSGIPVRPICID